MDIKICIFSQRSSSTVTFGLCGHSHHGAGANPAAFLGATLQTGSNCNLKSWPVELSPEKLYSEEALKKKKVTHRMGQRHYLASSMLEISSEVITSNRNSK